MKVASLVSPHSIGGKRSFACPLPTRVAVDEEFEFNESDENNWFIFLWTVLKYKRKIEKDPKCYHRLFVLRPVILFGGVMGREVDRMTDYRWLF